MTCGSCGGSLSNIRVQRSGSASGSSVPISKQVAPLRPQKIISRKVGPANHLDKRP